MKKTTTNRILIGFVILVWGTVLWRYVFSVEDTSRATKPVQLTQAAYASSDLTDSFELELDYPDPFLGIQLQASHKPRTNHFVQQTAQQQVGRVVSLAPKPTLPSIRFHGWVDKGDTLSGRALVSIDGSMWSLQTGDERDGVHVQDIHTYALTIQFADSTYVIARQ